MKLRLPWRWWPWRARAADEAAPTGAPAPVWCVVANVADTRPYGEGGREARRGTKHFPPGAKLYCFPPLWGDGFANVQVVGRHRGSHRYATMIVQARWLTNWRVELAYSPTVIRALGGHWDGSAAARARAEALVESLRARGSLESREPI